MLGSPLSLFCTGVCAEVCVWIWVAQGCWCGFLTDLWWVFDMFWGVYLWLTLLVLSVTLLESTPVLFPSWLGPRLFWLVRLDWRGGCVRISMVHCLLLPHLCLPSLLSLPLHLLFHFPVLLCVLESSQCIWKLGLLCSLYGRWCHQSNSFAVINLVFL